MDRLVGRIRPYPWGSRTAIAAVQGRPVPSDGPEAELWFGTHPNAPSAVVRDGQEYDLADVLAGAPAELLGTDGPDGYGTRLPFLLKLLAAEEPLSLQAHPDAAQARAGYDAEEAAGVPRDAPRRNYPDPHHKPELLCAVSEFDALCGFRPPDASADLLSALDAPLLAPVLADLRGAPAGAALRAAVTGLLTAPAEQAGQLLDEVLAGCRRLVAAGTDRPEYPRALELGERYPGDLGIVVALLLNLVRLRPDEAIFLPAGNLHGYLRGVGVEVMAASDNVLRGGFTGKHVDVPELLRVLRFEPTTAPVVAPVPVADGVVMWPTPVPEFELRRARVGGAVPDITLEARGPRILFCLSGQVDADDGVGSVRLAAGEAAFVPAGRTRVGLSGHGDVYQATTAGAPATG